MISFDKSDFGAFFWKVTKSKWIDLETEKSFWPLVFSNIESMFGSYQKKLLDILEATGKT